MNPRVISQFEVIARENIKCGDLIEIAIGGDDTLAIVTANHDGAIIDFIALRSSRTDIECPFFLSEKPGAFVKSFGSNWIIDVGSATGSSIASYSSDHPSGTIAFSGLEAVMLLFGRMKSELRSIDLLKCEGSNVPVWAVYARSWALWLTPEDRVKPGARPFFSFDKSAIAPPPT